MKLFNALRVLNGPNFKILRKLPDLGYLETNLKTLVIQGILKCIKFHVGCYLY